MQASMLPRGELTVTAADLKAIAAIEEFKGRWQAWLSFFLNTLVEQKNQLTAKVKEEQALRETLPVLSRTILELVVTRGEVSVQEVVQATNANRNTVKAHLQKLVASSYLTIVGKGRGVRYLIKK